MRARGCGNAFYSVCMCVCVLMERRKMKELGVFPAVGMETTLCTTNLADSEKQNSCKWCTHNRSGVCTCVLLCVLLLCA